jgi:thymidine phosphorylase
VLTDMDQPLGHAVGNALEVRETIATLKGVGPDDFTELALDAAGHLLALSDLGIEESEGRDRAAAAVQDGSALDAYERWVRAQGGDPAEDALPAAAVVRQVVAREDAHVQELGAVAVGLAALRLGAGRRTKDDAIDHAVGIRCLKKRGDAVVAGEPLAEVYARTGGDADRAAADVLAAYTFGSAPPARRPLVLETVG